MPVPVSSASARLCCACITPPSAASVYLSFAEEGKRNVLNRTAVNCTFRPTCINHFYTIHQPPSLPRALATRAGAPPAGRLESGHSVRPSTGSPRVSAARACGREEGRSVGCRHLGGGGGGGPGDGEFVVADDAVALSVAHPEVEECASVRLRRGFPVPAAPAVSPGRERDRAWVLLGTVGMSRLYRHVGVVSRHVPPPSSPAHDITLTQPLPWTLSHHHFFKISTSLPSPTST